MDSFDKKIADLYNGAKTPDEPPEGFGWDDMNDGIYDKMNEPKKKRRPVFWWSLFSGGILLILAIGWFYFSKKSVNTSDSNIGTTIVAEEKVSAINPIDSDKTTIEDTIGFTEKNSSSIVSNNKTINSQTKTSFSNKLTSGNSTNSEFSKKTDSQDPKIPSIQTTDNTEFMTELSRPETFVAGAEILSESMVGNRKLENDYDLSSLKKSDINYQTITFLPIAGVDLVAEESVLLALAPLYSTNNSLEKTTDKKKTLLTDNKSFHIYGGTLLTKGKYTANPNRNLRSQWLTGYYTGVEYSVLATKKWKLNLGYEHKFAVQLFDFQNITDTIPTGIEEVVTGITTNSLNGSRSEEREAVPTEAVRTRNVLHYNTFRSHALRLSLVRNFTLTKKFSLTAGLGGTYNFLTQTKGRTVNVDNEIFIYNSSEPIYKRRSFAVEGGLSLSYTIGKFSIRGNVWIEQPLSYSLEMKEEIRPTFYKIGLGVSRRF